MEWLNDYRAMVDAGDAGTLKVSSQLPKWVGKRLAWEVCSEFAMRAGIGRTLERNAEVTFDICSDELLQSLSKLHVDLHDELGDEFAGVSDSTVTYFALGVLHRMRHKGAVVHEALERFIQDGGETYYLTKIDKQTSKYIIYTYNYSRKRKWKSKGLIVDSLILFNVGKGLKGRKWYLKARKWYLKGRI